MKFIHLKGIGIIIFDSYIDHDKLISKLAEKTNADVISAGFTDDNDIEINTEWGSTSFGTKGNTSDVIQLNHQKSH